MDNVWRLVSLACKRILQSNCIVDLCHSDFQYIIVHGNQLLHFRQLIKVEKEYSPFQMALFSLFLPLLPATSSWSVLPHFDRVAKFSSFVQSPWVGLHWTLYGHSKVTLGMFFSTLRLKCFHLLGHPPEQFSLGGVSLVICAWSKS